MTTPDGAFDALRNLQHQLHRLGWQTNLHGDGPYPFLRISLDSAYREYVFVAFYDEPAYRWSNVAREHPVDDPVGATRRISSDLVQRHLRCSLARSRP